MSADGPIDVRLLDPSAARDAALVDRLAGLINSVYVVAESGLWRDGRLRTTASELAELIEAREIAVAGRGGEVAGVVHIHDVAADTSEFAMLATAPEARGHGVGRALVAFAEAEGSRRGLRAMQLSLLVPREWTHPNKAFLKQWYDRLGYRLLRTTTMAAEYPHLETFLATPCDLEIHEKSLRAVAPAS
jgi:GNAT superfamily N-acetyltransferase